MRLIPALLVISWLLLDAAHAQEPAGLMHCRSIMGSDERLSCYDKLADQAQQTAPTTVGRGYQTMSLTDVKLDQDGLRGREVEVSGNLVAVNAMALLRSSDTDTSPLVVDFKAVPREQRHAMLEHCGASGCFVTIRGRVDRVMAQPGIVADNLEVH